MVEDTKLLYDLRVEINQLNQEVHQLRGRSVWLISMVVTLALLLGGTSAWFIFQSQSQSKQLSPSDQDGSSTETVIGPADLARLSQVEAQVNNLRRDISEELVRELQSTQTQLQELKEQVQDIEQRQGNQRSPAPETAPLPNNSSDSSQPSELQTSPTPNGSEQPTTNQTP